MTAARLTRIAPLLAALALFGGVMAWGLRVSLACTEGHFTYAMDDAYIHMAVAKHLAQDGVWGVTRYAFSSSSSSPLWTLLLAGSFRLFGVHETIPLVLNLLFASLVLVWLWARVRARTTPFAAFLILAAAVIFPPLPTIVLGGMEHSLQALLVALFLAACADRIAAAPPRAPMPKRILALAALLPLARYEDLFAVLAAALVLFAYSRLRDAILLVVAAALPIAAFAIYSVAQGSLPLPNSVLLKGLPPTTADVLLALPHNLLRTKPTAGLLVLAGLLLGGHALRKLILEPGDRALLAMFTLTALRHLLLAQVGWLFRYEAYLVVLGVAAVGPVLVGAPGPVVPPARVPWRMVRAAAALFALAVAIGRVPVLERTVLATQNTYQQQYQTGRFLAAEYGGQVVAVSDVGAVNFLADLRCIDLLGLGDIQVARVRLAHGVLPASEADRIVHERGARIVVSYEHWFHGSRDGVIQGGTPPRWGEPVARWIVGDCVICGDDTLSFFGLDSAERDTLARRLAAFAPELPAGVVQVIPTGATSP